MSLTNFLLLAILLVLIVDACLRYAILRMVKPKDVAITQRFEFQQEKRTVAQAAQSAQSVIDQAANRGE